MKPELCPGCEHPYHNPGTECFGCVEHDGVRRWHRCLCHNRPNARKACPPQMDCQGGRFGYGDIWRLQRGENLRGFNGETITPDVLTEPTEQEQRQTINRLGLMVDEYSAGASALTDKLRKAREIHRKLCPFARGVLPPKAFTCGMCEVLDAPATPVPTVTDRADVSTRLMAVAEHTIVAEWICCEPLDPTHDLCAKGYATLEMTRALLVDDPEASVTAAPLLDTVMGLLSPANRSASLRDHIADTAAPFFANFSDEESAKINAKELADAVLALLPVLSAQADRSAGLRAAAELLYQRAKKLTGEFNDSDILHEDGPAATVATWKRAGDLLLVAAEEQPAETGEGRSLMRAHAALAEQAGRDQRALTEARATNRRLNLRAQQLESELATYRRAVAQWEVSEHRTYVPMRSLAAIAKAAGRDIETPQWLLHYQRVEQAEASVERVRERCQGVRDRSGPGGMINATQILGLLSPTWPDGNYEA